MCGVVRLYDPIMIYDIVFVIHASEIQVLSLWIDPIRKFPHRQAAPAAAAPAAAAPAPEVSEPSG